MERHWLRQLFFRIVRDHLRCHCPNQIHQRMHEGVEQLAPVRIFDLVDWAGIGGSARLAIRISISPARSINASQPWVSASGPAAEDLYTIRLKFFSDGRAHIGVDAGD